MRTDVIFRLRNLSGDDALQWAALYWQTAFKATFTDKTIGWRCSHHLSHIFNEVFEMARKTAQKDVQNGNRSFGSIDWVNVSLTLEDANEIEAWLTTEPDVLGELCRLVIEGGNIALKPANRGDGFMATLTLNADVSGNVGWGLSAFADTPYEAAACLLYKFVVKLDGNVTSTGKTTKPRFR